jgi:hypothetical protein
MTFNRVLNSILPSIIPKLAPNSLIALLIPRMLSGFHPFLYRCLVRATLNTRLNLLAFKFPPAVRMKWKLVSIGCMNALGTERRSWPGSQFKQTQ